MDVSFLSIEKEKRKKEKISLCVNFVIGRNQNNVVNQKEIILAIFSISFSSSLVLSSHLSF
jgi:hypothetical protein